MLPAVHRMHRSSDFASVIRSGDRARSAHLVLHHQRASTSPQQPALVGLVVSKAVGGSVVRHRVSRRLRAQLAARVHRLPIGSATVVRALPPAGRATSRALGADLDRALQRVVAPGTGSGGR